MQKQKPISEKEFNVKRYLGTAAYEAKRDEMQKDLNHNNVMFNVADEKPESNKCEPHGTGEENIFYKSTDEKKELKKLKKKHKKEYGY